MVLTSELVTDNLAQIIADEAAFDLVPAKRVERGGQPARCLDVLECLLQRSLEASIVGNGSLRHGDFRVGRIAIGLR